MLLAEDFKFDLKVLEPKYALCPLCLFLFKDRIVQIFQQGGVK